MDCCGSIGFNQQCECTEEGVWACLIPQRCPETCECPAELPGPDTKCYPSGTCNYGTEECCGQTFDSIRCRCSGDGQWACYFTEACMVPQCECPPWEPYPGDQCDPVLMEGQDCGYGEEECCGQVFDSEICSCSSDGTWQCVATEACMVPPCECPPGLENPGGAQCDPILMEGQYCGYGESECCGEVFDSLICSCSSDGTWGCLVTEACFAPPCECPPWAPYPGDQCDPVLMEGQYCGYGEEECCGKVFDSEICSCSIDGTWDCLATDACLAPNCN
jgi:hypothetical protein